MAQEDDLRALGKVMDFMPGYIGDISPYQLLLVLLRSVSRVALHARYHQQDTDELPTYHRLVFVHPLDETLLCGVSCFILPWDKRRERRENHMVKDLGSAFRRFCVLLSQLVALSIAHRQDRSSFALHLHAVRWLYLSADGWRLDEPTIEE